MLQGSAIGVFSHWIYYPTWRGPIFSWGPFVLLQYKQIIKIAFKKHLTDIAVTDTDVHS